MGTKAPKAVIDHLKAVPLFETCDEADLTAIANLGTLLRMRPGTTLAAGGSIGSQFIVIMRGEARAAVDGQEMAMLGPGAFFGEQWLLGERGMVPTVVAVTDVDALVFSRAEFGELIRSSPALRAAIVHHADAFVTA